MHALTTKPPRRGQNGRERVVRFAVGEQHEDPVGDSGTGREELPALLQHRRQLRPTGAHHVGVETLYQQLQGTIVHRERREDETAASEGDEPDSITSEILYQPADLLLHPTQPRGRHVFRQHRAGDIHRHDECERLGFRRHHPPTKPRTGQRDTSEQRSDSQRHHASPARAGGDGSQLAGPDGGAPNTRTAGPDSQPPYHCRHDRGGIQNERRVKRNHGTRTTKVAPITSSNASAASPISSGMRYDSLCWVNRVVCTGVFSSWSIC